MPYSVLHEYYLMLISNDNYSKLMNKIARSSEVLSLKKNNFNDAYIV